MTDRNGSVEIIGAMMDRLPPVGSVWPMSERVLWLQAMESVLHMVYGPVETIDVSGLLPIQREAAGKLIEGLAEENARRAAAAQSSAEPTDEALAGKSDVASGSREASTTEASDDSRVGGERSSSAEAAPAEEREDAYNAAARAAAARTARAATNVGGRPSKDRPPHIPTNLAMAIEGIKKLGPCSAVQLRAFVRETYWPDAPDHWAATLYDYVKARRLSRDGEGRFDLPVAGAEPQSLPAVRSKPAAPPVVPKPAPPPKTFSQGVDFEHNGRKTNLPTSRAYVMAGKLRVVMGQPIDEAFLATSVLGSNTEKNRNDARDICLGLNGPLSAIGLQIEYRKGVGLTMREIGE